MKWFCTCSVKYVLEINQTADTGAYQVTLKKNPKSEAEKHFLIIFPEVKANDYINVAVPESLWIS